MRGEMDNVFYFSLNWRCDTHNWWRVMMMTIVANATSYIITFCLLMMRKGKHVVVLMVSPLPININSSQYTNKSIDTNSLTLHTRDQVWRSFLFNGSLKNVDETQWYDLKLHFVLNVDDPPVPLPPDICWAKAIAARIIRRSCGSDWCCWWSRDLLGKGGTPAGNCSPGRIGRWLPRSSPPVDEGRLLSPLWLLLLWWWWGVIPGKAGPGGSWCLVVISPESQKLSNPAGLCNSCACFANKCGRLW